jgi:hypothetical protein
MAATSRFFDLYLGLSARSQDMCLYEPQAIFCRRSFVGKHVADQSSAFVTYATLQAPKNDPAEAQNRFIIVQVKRCTLQDSSVQNSLGILIGHVC